MRSIQKKLDTYTEKRSEDETTLDELLAQQGLAEKKVRSAQAKLKSAEDNLAKLPSREDIKHTVRGVFCYCWCCGLRVLRTVILLSCVCRRLRKPGPLRRCLGRKF